MYTFTFKGVSVKFYRLTVEVKQAVLSIASVSLSANPEKNLIPGVLIIESFSLPHRLTFLEVKVCGFNW